LACELSGSGLGGRKIYQIPFLRELDRRAAPDWKHLVIPRSSDVSYAWQALPDVVHGLASIMALDCAPMPKQWDFSASKSFRFAESKNMQFRVEFFNIFNHANFGLPNNDLKSQDFGQIQSAQPGRLVQLAMKFLF
jgi:hypothetical protein